MTDHSIRRSDFRAWPLDPAAREALEIFFTINEPGPVDGVRKGLEAPQLDLRGADLSGLDLAEAYLLGANLRDVSLAGSNLSSATLSGADLQNSDLSGAMLLRAEVSEATASNASLQRASAVSVDFSRTDLRGLDARDAVLNSSRFSGADLSQADLRNAALAACRFGSERRPTVLTNARMASAVLSNATGHVIGPIDIATGGKQVLIGGSELAQWLTDQGAPHVDVVG